MNLLKRLFGSSSPSRKPSDTDPYGLIYFVKGNKCGAITRIRIDSRNDLSAGDGGGYYVHKTIVDGKCYGQVDIDLSFDDNRKEVERSISGGEFVTREAWESKP